MSAFATFGDFHFLRPYWLLLALPLLAILLWMARHRARDGDWRGVIDGELLPALRLASGDSGPRRSPLPWLGLAWLLAIGALAGPAWQRESSQAFSAPGAWVLVLDLSPSMQAADLAPDRVTRMRYAIDDLLGAAHDARVALVVFSDEPYTVAPLTEDVATIRALLQPLTPDIMPSAGDALGPALMRAGELLAQTAAGERRVIVLSDGFADPAAAFGAAGKLRADGVRIDVVGIGTAGGAPLPAADGGFEKDAQGATRLSRLDPAALQNLAQLGGGSYAEVSAMGGLLAGLQATSATKSGEQADKDIQLAHWRDAGVWLLPVILLFTALLARRGWL